MKKLIVFVCKGNIHRSAVAEQYLKLFLSKTKLSNEFEVVSRGISAPKHKNMTEYPEHWKTTRPILRELGLNVTVFSGHEAKLITKEIMDQSYVIFAMDKEVLQDHEASLIKQFPQYIKKIRIFASMIGDQDDVLDCGHHPNNADLHRLVNEKIVNTIRRGFLSWMKKED